MKFLIATILYIVAIVGFVAMLFTVNQVNREEGRLRLDLQHRSSLLAESFKESVEPNFLNKSDAYLKTVVEKFTNRERFAGLAVFDNQGKVIAVSSSLASRIKDLQKTAVDVMDVDTSNGKFINFEQERMYLFVVPMHNEERVVGALLIAQHAGYIANRMREIWSNNLWRLVVQAVFVSLALLLVIRWMMYKPVKTLVASLRSARTDSALNSLENGPNYPFLKPLLLEISKIGRSLKEARRAACDEARLRLEKVDSPWTEERLKEFIRENTKGKAIFVVSNREPYIHTGAGNRVRYFFPASGMATALEPLMRACGGTWIAHGSGDADALMVDKHDHVRVPPDDPKYTLRRVWLTEEEERGYYYG